METKNGATHGIRLYQLSEAYHSRTKYEEIKDIPQVLELYLNKPPQELYDLPKFRNPRVVNKEQ